MHKISTMVTAADLLQEMQSFVHVKPELITKAKKAKVNEKNNSVFRDVLQGWKAGDYDESPEQVVTDIEHIITYKPS